MYRVITDINFFKVKTSGTKGGVKYLCLFIAFLFSLLNASGQTTVNYSIGEIIAAGSAGLMLADGTVAHAEIVTLGSGNPSNPEHGTYNITSFGGELNGISDANTTSGTVADLALTLPGYTGSKVVGQFTRFAAPPASIDNGINGAKFGNAVGFRVWLSKPVDVKQFLMVDIDGEGDNSEWGAIFGYNGITQVLPSSIVAGSSQTSSNRAVNNNWSALVASKIPGVVAFTNMTFPRETDNPNNSPGDPDDPRTQALFNFSSPVDNIFFLFGINGDRTGVPGMQNIGVTPISILVTVTPVILEKFIAKAENCNTAVLSWAIGNAVNFDRFEIEKMPAGGSFTKAGTIIYRNDLNSYAYIDDNLTNGTYQYRLKMIDKDSKFSYSDIIVVKITCGDDPVVNSTSNDIKISGLKGGEVLQVLAYNGQIMAQRKAAHTQENIDISRFANGVYTIVVLKSAEKLLVKKVIKR